MNTLSGWNINYALIEGFDTEFPIERPCIQLTVGQDIPTEDCYVTAVGTSAGTVMLPVMPAYTTLQLVAIIEIDPGATLQDRQIGIKVLSAFGSSEIEGDSTMRLQFGTIPVLSIKMKMVYQTLLDHSVTLMSKSLSSD